MRIDVPDSLLITFGLATLAWVLYSTGAIPDSLKTMGSSCAKMFLLQMEQQEGRLRLEVTEV